MRITYRSHSGNRAYWQQRWDRLEADLGELEPTGYPGRYVEQVLGEECPDGPFLEAGCGAGRVLLYCARRGRPIIGIDFIPSALSAIRGVEHEIPLAAADVRKLPFADASFAAIFAFGLYHNLEHGLEFALRESRRVLKPSGVICASLRLDNIQNRVIDHLAEGNTEKEYRNFHKINLTKIEIENLFYENGFEMMSVTDVDNMPFFYKFSIFRSVSHKIFNETRSRAEGYQLSPFANVLQHGLKRMLPWQFSNLALVLARVR